MFGEAAALAGAFTWAINSVLVKSQSSKLSALSLNAVQYSAATLPFLALLPFTGTIHTLARASTLSIALLIGTAVVSMVGGDTAYVRSLRLLGVSKAFPIAMCTYPLLSSIVAVSFLGEPFTWRLGTGAPMVLFGLYLVTPRSSQTDRAAAASPSRAQGIVCALAAAFCWAAAVLTLKLVLTEVDAFSATAIRVPMAALVLVPLAALQRRGKRDAQLDRRSLAITAAAGLIGVALGTVLFMLAIQNAGAARATILFATSPLFALVFSVVFLKEHITRLVALGTVASVTGICLVVI